MSHLTRAMRLLDMLRRLRVRGYTTEELAGVYGVSVRTVQADLQELGGYPEYAPLMCKVVWWSAEQIGAIDPAESEPNLEESCV